MEIAPGISHDPSVCHGAAVLTGTRIPVSIIVGSLGGGMTREEVEREYGVSKESIEAALTYAASVLSSTTDIPLVS